MLDNLPNEVISKIYMYTSPYPNYLPELKKLINRIKKYDKSILYIDCELKVVIKRSKKDEIVDLFLEISKTNYNESDFFEINVSQAILLCLDKYVPVNPGYYLDRRFSILCSNNLI